MKLNYKIALIDTAIFFAAWCSIALIGMGDTSGLVIVSILLLIPSALVFWRSSRSQFLGTWIRAGILETIFEGIWISCFYWSVVCLIAFLVDTTLSFQDLLKFYILIDLAKSIGILLMTSIVGGAGSAIVLLIVNRLLITQYSPRA